MRYSIVKLSQLSGDKASVFSVVQHGEHETFLEKFLNENKDLFLSETNDILSRLRAIGLKTGARIEFFREKEGVPGDGVCYLYYKKKSKLRLYCIRNGASLLILGSGGPKETRTLQEDEKLKKENYFMR